MENFVKNIKQDIEVEIKRIEQQDIDILDKIKQIVGFIQTSLARLKAAVADYQFINPSEEQLQVIYEALDIIQKSEFHEYMPHSIAIINDKVNSGAPWGYAPFVGGDIYLNSKLLELPPKLVASTIVHEVTHRRQGRFTAGMHEREAYQMQSNFLRTVGVTGTISEIYKKDASVKAPKPTAFLMDLKEVFKELNIYKPAIF